MQFHISEQVKVFRLRRGWTQPDLAAESGVTLAMLRKIEAREVSVREGDLEKLAKCFGLELVITFKPLA